VDAIDGPLTAEQARVLGALAEKEATVPDTYPMTLRGLQQACNQTNNREPVTDHDEGTILRTLDELKARHLVRFVHPSHGARTTKYRHVLDERLGLEHDELALLTVLLLRGPQTVNELRTRTERAHRFGGNDEVVDALERMAGRDEPLVVHLPRQSGQKETRWMHLLGGDVEATATPPVGTGEPAAAPAAPAAGLAARVAELEDRVAALEEILAELGLTESTTDDRTPDDSTPGGREQPPS
jgi:hypothetical protein